MEEVEKKINNLFEKGILVNRELVEKNLDDNLLQKIETEADLIVLNSDYVEVLEQESSLVDWYEIDVYRVEVEKDRDDELYQSQLQGFRNSTLLLQSSAVSTSQIEQHKQKISSLETTIEVGSTSSDLLVEGGIFNKDQGASLLDEGGIHQEMESTPSFSIQPNKSVTVVVSHENKPKKYSVEDFSHFFLSRYRYLESILRQRQELQNTATINRILGKNERENVAIIGLVENIGETKNGNLIATIEDPTGTIKVLISKNKKELLQEGKDLVPDEVIGISGTLGDKIIFAEKIVWPDIPNTNEIKKGPVDEFAIFLSDLHVGSKLFCKTEFDKFLQWIRGEVGNEEQRQVAQKVKYVFIAGDLVDGVGIYPSQEEELEIKDIKGQYEETCRLLNKIPPDKQIIICPGNHDAIHLAEPQPSFNPRFSPGLFKMPNVTLVSNPSIVKFAETEGFSGFEILFYHGYSFDFYVANVESIRSGGGYHRSDLIMKFLLKRRHLAPSFKSTPYYPSFKEDPLLIKKVPDFFLTGHIHYSTVANYKGVTMICGSCWQEKTDFQEKLGHEPEPARVPLVNLKTREIKILRFG